MRNFYQAAKYGDPICSSDGPVTPFLIGMLDGVRIRQDLFLSYRQHLCGLDVNHAMILGHISALSSCINKVDGVPAGKHHLVHVAQWILGNTALNLPLCSLIPPLVCACGPGGWDGNLYIYNVSPPKLPTLKVCFSS